MSAHAARGIKAFACVWLGQLVSGVGTGLTSFALGIWVYQQTGSATQFALIFFFSTVAGGLTLPLAGTLVDRWNRRTVLL